MKLIELQFKTPDVMDQLADRSIPQEDLDWIKSRLKYGEYITLIFDTENKTVSVKE